MWLIDVNIFDCNGFLIRLNKIKKEDREMRGKNKTWKASGSKGSRRVSSEVELQKTLTEYPTWVHNWKIFTDYI